MAKAFKKGQIIYVPRIVGAGVDPETGLHTWKYAGPVSMEKLTQGGKIRVRFNDQFGEQQDLYTRPVSGDLTFVHHTNPLPDAEIIDHTDRA